VSEGLILWFTESPFNMGERWTWSDMSNSTDFDGWSEGYPDTTVDNAACVYLDDKGGFHNRDCSGLHNNLPNHFICKSPKCKILRVSVNV